MGGLRLLFLTQTYPRFDGDTAGPFIRDLARGLVRLGDRVTVLAPHAPQVREAWDDDGVEVKTFRYAPERFERVGYSRSLRADETVRGGAAITAPLYLLGARRALVRELEAGPYDLIHAHWVIPNGPVAAPPPWLPGARPRPSVPVAVGLHGSDVFVAEKPGIRRIVKGALGRARLLTGCSPELVDRVCALGFPRERSRVIPYGVDTELFSPAPDPDQPPDQARDQARGSRWRQKLGISPQAPLILGVGRMATKKGFQILLDVLPELMDRSPAAHLVLAGGGDREEEFERRAAPFAGRVHFPGSVLRDTLPDLYRAADLFVLPAVHDRKGNVDGLPNVILEAMSSGLPVVASAISGIPQAVEDGVNGRLVPEGDAPALFAALSELLADRRKRRALGAAGREKVLRELTWDAVAGRYRQAYVDTLGRELGS